MSLDRKEASKRSKPIPLLARRGGEQKPHHGDGSSDLAANHSASAPTPSPSISRPRRLMLRLSSSSSSSSPPPPPPPPTACSSAESPRTTTSKVPSDSSLERMAPRCQPEWSSSSESLLSSPPEAPCAPAPPPESQLEVPSAPQGRCPHCGGALPESLPQACSWSQKRPSLVGHQSRLRSYLHGRLSAIPLLGTAELERALPMRQLRLLVGTWNMNARPPPPDLFSLVLPDQLGHAQLPHLVVVGTQEGLGPSERLSWEVSLQETLGPPFVMIHSVCMGSLHLAVFLRRELVWFCSIAEDSCVGTRAGPVAAATSAASKTKGAVAIAFVLFGTSFLFITSHLSAHVHGLDQRLQEVSRICSALELPRILPPAPQLRQPDATDNFDFVVWSGDLNFRLEQSREQVTSMVAKKDWGKLLQGDQLRPVLARGKPFRRFQEAPIRFPPTYKMDIGSSRYDTSAKKRCPAYTDRIIWKHRPHAKPTSILYSDAPSIMTSDHRPVWSLMQLVLRPGKDTIPLSGGLFNREVYLAGLERRVKAMEPLALPKSSVVCSLQ